MQVIHAHMLQREQHQHRLCLAVMHCCWGGLHIHEIPKPAIQAVTEALHGKMQQLGERLKDCEVHTVSRAGCLSEVCCTQTSFFGF